MQRGKGKIITSQADKQSTRPQAQDIQPKTDAVTSRVDENRDIAIDLLRQAGAVISSTEIIIFQWARGANTDEFRKILAAP